MTHDPEKDFKEGASYHGISYDNLVRLAGYLNELSDDSVTMKNTDLTILIGLRDHYTRNRLTVTDKTRSVDIEEVIKELFPLSGAFCYLC